MNVHVNVYLCVYQEDVFMNECGKITNNLERHFFSPEELTQHSKHTLLQLSFILITVVF